MKKILLAGLPLTWALLCCVNTVSAQTVQTSAAPAAAEGDAKSSSANKVGSPQDSKAEAAAKAEKLQRDRQALAQAQRDARIFEAHQAAEKAAQEGRARSSQP